MVSKIIINKIKKKIQKGCEFKINNCVFELYYNENVLILKCYGFNSNELLELKDELSNFSDLSDVLISKVKNEINAKQINRLDLFLKFENATSQCEVYYINQLDKKIKIKLDEII